MSIKTIIKKQFFLREVNTVAKDLLGKILCTSMNGEVTKGLIVETEAYADYEKACHAYGGRKTNRTSTLYLEGGTSYVYLIYGMYSLFNVVVQEVGIGQAVLIRALEPVEGIETMKVRRPKIGKKYGLTSGPGKLTIAMGIDMKHNRSDVFGPEVWIENGDDNEISIIETTRIGVDYAEDDALLPWRYYIGGNPWVSQT